MDLIRTMRGVLNRSIRNSTRFTLNRAFRTGIFASCEKVRCLVLPTARGKPDEMKVWDSSPISSALNTVGFVFEKTDLRATTD